MRGVSRTVVSLALLVGLAGWSLWVNYEHLAFGPYSYVRQHDTAEGNGSFYRGQSEYARRNLLGYWTPSAASGVDSLANGKGVQPLFEAPFRFAPRWWVFGGVVWLETLAAALFTVVLLRRHLAVAFIPALVAGLSFSLMYDGAGAHSGFFLGTGIVVPGFPLLLLGLTWAAARPTPTAMLSAAALGIVLALSSHVVLAAAGVSLAVLWVFAVEPHRRRSFLLVLAVCSLTLLIMSAPTLAAAAMNGADSHRDLWPKVPLGVSDEAAAWSVQRSEAASLLAVNAPLLMAAVTGWLLGGWRHGALNAVMLAALFIILQVYLFVPIYSVLHAVSASLATAPFVRVQQEYVQFLSAAAGAIGLRQIIVFFGDRKSRLMRRLGTVGVAITCMATVWVTLDRSVAVRREREDLRRSGANYASFFERPVLRELARRTESEPLFRVATFAEANERFGGQHPGFAWAYGLETADGYLNLYPRRYHEFWAWVIKPALDVRDDVREYFEHWGNRIYLFSSFLPAQKTYPAAEAFNLNLLSLANVRYIVSAVALKDSRLVEWSGNRGVPQLQPQREAGGADALVKQVFVYENRSWLPRFFVTTRSRVFDTEPALLEALASADVEELRYTAFLETGNAGLFESNTFATHSPAEPQATVRVRHYSADRIELQVDSKTGGMLVVANSYSQYWHGSVNGRSVRVVPTDFAFQGVPIAAGTSDVLLAYDPPYALAEWQRGLSVATVVVILLISWHFGRARRSESVELERNPGRGVRIAALIAVVAVALAVGIVRSMRAESAAAEWIGVEWPYRQQLIVQNPKAMSPPTDVPLLVQRGPEDAAFWNQVSASAAGIRFTDEHGRVLPYEIDTFDPARRLLIAWVLVPRLDVDPKNLYMYYGNTSAGDAQAPDRVWSGRYVAVWHMNGASGGTTIQDSTVHENHGELSPEMAQRWKTTGRIGDALLFGGGDSLTIPSSADWTFGRGDWSLEFWIKPAELKKRNFGLFQYGPGKILWYLHNGNILVAERQGQDPTAAFAKASLALDQWNHVTFAHVGSILKVLLNGEFTDITLEPTEFAALGAPEPVSFGTGWRDGLEGVVDEVRISKGRLPPGWTRTVYLAQTDRLIRFGPEERYGSHEPQK